MSVAADIRHAPFDVESIRKDFPCLHQQVNGKPLIYLDNAATSQVPQVVVDALVNYHTRDRANIHRGVHELSQRASAAYDLTRGKVAGFLGVAARGRRWRVLNG